MAKTIILFDVADPSVIRLRAHLDTDAQLDDPAFRAPNAQTARLSLDRAIGETLQIIETPVMGMVDECDDAGNPVLDANGDPVQIEAQIGTHYDNQWIDLTTQAASLFSNGAADMIAGASASGKINGYDCTVEIGG